MKARAFLAFVVLVLVATTLVSYGQMMKRTDAIWARQVSSPISANGILSEPAWAAAESINVVYGQDAGIPGSGWRHEQPDNEWRKATDPTRATIKFLVHQDSLYLAVIVKDSSVGGGPFNKKDAFLMNLRYKLATGFQGSPTRDWNTGQAYEIFYGWVKEGWADTLADQPGRLPGFFGWGSSDPYKPRPDSMKAIWDAVTTVQGTQNSDGIVDQGYTTEMKFNLKDKGYTATATDGDVIMFSVSIYDGDWFWPQNTTKMYGNRVYVQGPWGNASAFNHLRIWTRPNVTTTSGAVPTIGPDLVIPGSNYANIVFDGKLTDGIWKNPNVGTLQMKYGDAAIRNSYPATAKYRSGHVETGFNGGTQAVTDPNLVNVKYFYKADTLFMGFDVYDRVVQDAGGNRDRWDAFSVILCQRDYRDADSALGRRVLSFVVSGSGTNLTVKREDDLALSGWDSLAQAVQVAMSLKGGTTIDTLGATADTGYTAEVKINLRKLGYPAGRGDGVVFLGIVHHDGDSFTPASKSYGTQTWFMRRGGFEDGAAWCYMDPGIALAVDDKGAGTLPEEFALLGNYPNPFNPSTTIKFVMPQTSEVTLEIFDVLGRLVATRSLGVCEPGDNQVTFNAANLASGMYNYRLRMASTQATVAGKMMLVK